MRTEVSIRHGRHLKENIIKMGAQREEVAEKERFLAYFHRVWVKPASWMIIITFCIGFGLTYWDIKKIDYYKRLYSHVHYIVKTGDTIDSISKKFIPNNSNIATQIIMDWNDINNNKLFKGQELFVPVPNKKTAQEYENNNK